MKQKGFYNLFIENRSDKILLTIFSAVILILILISFFYNFNFKSSYLKESDFHFFYTECKTFFSDKDYYKHNYIQDLHLTDSNKSVKLLFPPVIYYFLYPLTIMPYPAALVSFILFNLLIYIFSILLIINYYKRFLKYKFFILLLALLFPPFLYVIITGQISLLWVFILILSFYFAKKEKIFFAGVILSLFLLKPSFFVLIFIILFLSFKGRLFFGLITGALIMILITGYFSGFALWIDWFKIGFNVLNKIFYKDVMVSIKQSADKIFFYPMKSLSGILIGLEYFFSMTGIFAILAPIIYSFNHTKNFSRNSFWFIFIISFVLANPYLYNYELVILILPLLIFINLMLADRVQPKHIIFVTCSFIVLLSLLYILSIFIYIQLLTLVFWFFLVNSVLGKRIKHFMPKTYIDYWNNY